jgi:uncharacterized membrane protein required for colicin V production
MELLQRLQALDILFAILWATIVGWGLQAGVVRQIGMLVGVYGAALVTGSAYRYVGQALAQAFGKDILPQLEFVGYVALFVVTFGILGLIIWRAYPSSRLSRQFGAENVLGGAVGAVWGVLFLIAILTILRYYAVVPWKEQEMSQQAIRGQIQSSQVAPVLQVVAAPLWDVMAPWFPTPVTPRL